MTKEERINQVKAKAEKLLRKGQTIEEKYCLSYTVLSTKFVGNQWAITYELFDTRTPFIERKPMTKYF